MHSFQRNLSHLFYALVSLPATAMGFALSVQISALSWLLTTQYHLDIEQVGIVWAAGPIAGILGQVLVGVISDRIWVMGGRRRPFILLGGTLASLMLLALPNIHRIQQVIPALSLLTVATAVALTLDLAINISFNPTRSLIADTTPRGEARTRGYTWMQTVSGFFGVLAYLISAWMGNLTLIYCGFFLVLLFSVLPMLVVREPRQLCDSDTSEGSDSPDSHGDSSQLFPIFFAHAFSWIGIQTMFIYIIAFIQQKMTFSGDSQQVAHQVGQVIAVAFAFLNTVGFLLPAPFLLPMARRFGQVRVHTAAVATMALGYVLIALGAKDPITLYVLMAVVGVGWASVVSLPFAIMSEKVATSKMGLFMGLFNLSVVIPQLFVSLVLGSVIKNAPDKSLIFWICGASLGLSALGWLMVRDQPSESSTCPAN